MENNTTQQTKVRAEEYMVGERTKYKMVNADTGVIRGSWRGYSRKRDVKRAAMRRGLVFVD